MKFKNKASGMILILFVIIINYIIAYFVSEIEYKIFVILYTTWASIMYIFTIFEYYEVNEESLIHIKKLGFEKKEALWKDINSIYLYPNKYFIKAIRLRYGTLNEKEIVINTGVKNYKELIKIVLDKTKDNPQISVDIKVHELLK